VTGGPGWDISFLRVGALATAAVAAVGIPVAGLVGGWSAALGVLAGALVVTAFFCISGVVIAWAGRIDDALTLPAALGTFLVKAVVFFAVLSALPPDGWVDRLALAWSVVVGALLWSGVQARWVWTRQLYYVTPPSPPAPSPGIARPDPEKPASRG
jgi:ATP synthase protein I